MLITPAFFIWEILYDPYEKRRAPTGSFSVS